MPCPVEELVWNDELKRLMLFFQRTDSRNGNDALDPELLEAMNVGSEIQFAGQDAVPAPVSRQKGYLATLKRTEHIGVRGRAERRLQLDFVHLAQPRHRIQPTAADDSDFRLWQTTSDILAPIRNLRARKSNS